MTALPNTQFWLAKLDRHGTPDLIDGAHSTRNGVEQAAYLFARFGLAKGERLACAEVIVTEIDAKPHGANEEAIGSLNGIGVRP